MERRSSAGARREWPPTWTTSCGGTRRLGAGLCPQNGPLPSAGLGTGPRPGILRNSCPGLGVQGRLLRGGVLSLPTQELSLSRVYETLGNHWPFPF